MSSLPNPGPHEVRSSSTDQYVLQTESLADQLYRIISNRIIDGHYPAGSRLDPQAIAREFTISRTPVRDALAQLEADSLIETRPRAGTFVVNPTLRDISEVCQVRKGIEWEATGLATPLMSAALLRELRDEIVYAEQEAKAGRFEAFFESDARLHQEIVEATGNSRLIRVRASLTPFVAWLRVLGGRSGGPHRIHGACQDHLDIVDAMLESDADRARAAAAQHLDHVEAWTVADMTGTLDP